MVLPDGYVVYDSTNSILPLTNWNFVTNFSGIGIISSSSNYVAITNWVVTVNIGPPVFFYIVYSNSFGSTPVSDIANTPSYVKPGKLKVGKIYM